MIRRFLTTQIQRKTSTGLTGLPVHPQPRETLIALYNTTLEESRTLPESSFYRKSVESITQKRLQLVEQINSNGNGNDLKSVEEKLAGGQAEELILQAQDELSLLRKMKEWKPWEPLEVKPSENQWKYF